jgi:hypothetical protein
LIVVAFSIAGYAVGEAGYKKVKVLRILRVLRPLRLISRNKGLKLAINSLLRSVPSLLNLLVLCFLFFLLFGIFGVNYFKGCLYSCDIDGPHIKDKWDCFDYGGNWVNADRNFDDIFSAMTTLFVLSTTEGWVAIMWQGIDSIGIDQ